MYIYYKGILNNDVEFLVYEKMYIHIEINNLCKLCFNLLKFKINNKCNMHNN